MNKLKFMTQKEAVKHFGHSWKYIEKHYKVSYCYTTAGFRGYFIEKKIE